MPANRPPLLAPVGVPLPASLTATLDAAARVLESPAPAPRRRDIHMQAAQAWLDALAKSEAPAIKGAEQAQWHWQQALRWGHDSDDPRLVLRAWCGLAQAAMLHSRALHEAGDEGAARVACNRGRDACFAIVRGLGAHVERSLEIQLLGDVAALLDSCGDNDDAEAMRDRARRLAAPQVPVARGLDPVTRASVFGSLG